jgi:predicted nuclease with TOPRIM domain
MPPSRLARYFKGSRDNWKNKALEKQSKLRGFEQRIRDLEESRQQWREKSKKAEEKVKKLEKELEKLKKNPKNLSEIRKGSVARAISHHYTIQTIQISVQQIIDGGNSYRSTSKIMRLLSENFERDYPHFSRIRKWVGRVGLYELDRKKANP